MRSTGPGVLVTGGAGFIGSRLSEELLPQKYHGLYADNPFFT
jgi:nucleoside-diphosphate-sugar epimerase